MYIRWKRCALRRTADVTLKAFLVHSVRVAGRPRQRILGYLGAIRVRYQQAPALAHLAATLGDPRTRRAPRVASMPHAGHDTERGASDGTPHDSPASH